MKFKISLRAYWGLKYSDEINIVKSESTIEIEDESITNFCNALVESYRNDNRISNTKFKSNSSFETIYQEYKRGRKDFVVSTCELIDSMGLLLENTKTAKGGKFAFIEEENKGNSYFYVFLIRDTKGGQIEYSEKNSKYILNSIEYADTNNLAMAARLNHNIYRNTEEKDLLNYLSFTYSGTKQSEVSDYFSNWLGAADLHKNSGYASHTDLQIGTL